jgi:RimJ/RimL family protein N-acetyltransferase
LWDTISRLQGEARVKIRQAHTGDVDTLVTLNAIPHRLHLAAHPERFRPTRSDEVAAWFQQLLGRQEVRIWIAEVDGAAVGYAVARLHRAEVNPFCVVRRWYEIEEVGVKPTHRRQGVCKALFGAVKDHALAAGITELELQTYCFNSTALAAFKQLGFEPQSTRFRAELAPGAKPKC